ncbi:DNA gyrase subunit A [Muribaculum intestinale]|jgi:DNA gyrase subunit A|uniref:DNA gyrase subunit A n=1 Tax=Muribaculum intestinale TaxID=1796646 RepID=UPI000F481D10|nr:DNA gyrase subunit A [Muribaculum intestinale]ROT09531.1 DNA gyrase subunit A [Muribaculaceae bacterium Isolate-100 (HZI)]RXE64701.1 DNA gyrase subunit A [Muribaculaceae bacterium Isolate-007 (NCI)]TGX86528.1 DNA gyrase subunit A [Muribaculum intestinale]
MLEEDRILKIDIENEMKSAYIDYSMSVIVSRALPDVRDGLKPVQRRVLFGMNEMGNTSDHPHKKSANCVGEVMGKYHPHGDSSIYGTVVRMAQPWALRYTLVDGHGNFGSVDGDGPAAMRYTEVRLEHIGEEMLSDIDSDTVDFQPNYDNSRQEPVVLPTRIPNLLVNGTSGIAVGMATNMPPHNLTESINATVALIDNPELTIAELMKYIKAPDFPTGGTIYGYNGVKEAFETGRGRIVIRAKAEIEAHSNHEDIIVTEIPYNVNKAELIKYIADLVNEKKIDGIADLNDESDYKGMRIVIRLKSDANANVVLNKLYKLTQMQSSFSVNNVAIVNGRPRTLNLKELLQAFIDHRHEVVTRRTRFELRKAEERAHILQGLIIAEQNIDEVIQIIKNADSVEDARAQLSARFDLTEPQTLAIVEMKLRSLAKLEQDKLRQQYADLERLIEHLNLILSDEHECRELIKSELLEIRDKYGDARKTDIDYTAGDFNAEDFYADDDMIITISHLGYIKRTPLSEFRAQARGGVGSRGSNTRDEDFIEHIYPASMHNTMLFFTDRGLVYKMKVYELPEGAKNSKGRALQNLLDIEPGDKVRAYIACKQLDDPEFTGSHFLVFATRKGVVKKTSLTEYARVMSKGKKAIIIREDDSLIGVELTDNNSTILLAAKEGKAIRFATSSLRAMGRVSTGVRGMRVEGTNEVIGMITMEPDSTNTVMVISENGYGKRTALDAYTPHNRGGKGMKTINVTDKTGPLVGFLSVNDDNDLIIINQSGITIRIHMSDLRVMGRATQGVRLINLEKRNDTIASVCCVDSDPEETVDNDILVAEAEQEEIEFSPEAEEPDDDINLDDTEDTDSDE